MTLDKVARMVAKGFDRVDERFEQVETKIDETRQELKDDISGVRIIVGETYTILDEREKEIADLKERVEILESKVFGVSK